MQALELSLHIGPDELLRLYRGRAQVVLARAEDGRKVQFPAQALRPFVTELGVQGRFRLRFDDQHKLVGLERLGD